MDQRIAIASDAIQKSLENLNLNNRPSPSAIGYLLAEMVEFDIATNQTKYKNWSNTIFSTMNAQHPGFRNQYLDYALMYGYAAIRAYRAYNDDVFLGYAQTVWEFGRVYTLTEDEAQAGSAEMKSFPISSQCQGVTMAGGSFWQTSPTDPSLNVLSTAYFLLLSALLGQATSNQTYIDAATLSTNFMHAHIYTVDNIVQDSISARANDSCRSSPSVHGYNFGLMIEGLAVLSSVTTQPETTALMLNTINAAVTRQLFQGANGIISIGSSHSGELRLVRGFLAAYNSNQTDYDTKEFLKQYISVQYNAVLDQATIAGSDIYGSAWVGPPATTFSDANQTNSLVPLIGALYLPNNTDANDGNGAPGGGATPDDPSTTHGPQLQSSKPRAGLLAGIVIGGLALVGLVAAAFFLWSRKKPKYSGLVQPFIAEAPPARARDPYHESETGSTSFSSRRFKRSRYGPSSTRSQHRPEAADGLPTSKLVRLLHERLQQVDASGPWNSEKPPEYSECV